MIMSDHYNNNDDGVIKSINNSNILSRKLQGMS